MFYTPLPQRALLAVTGEERVAFLQGIVSVDVTRLKDGEATYGALLSPQGKFLHDFFIVAESARFLLDGEKARINDLRQRLMLYKLRSKVQIDILPESEGVIAAWGGESSVLGIADPRVAIMGFRLSGNLAELDAACAQAGWKKATPEEYESLRLEHGVPDGSRDMIVDKSLLLEGRFDALGGVDFAKGCYIGQEVTARSKFRGQVRKLLYRVKSESGALPETGTPVLLGEAVVGEMRSRLDGTGLAFIKQEIFKQEALESPDATLRSGAESLYISVPEWDKSAAGE